MFPVISVDYLAERVRRLDERLRRYDFAINRTVGGKLGRFGITRHTGAAVLLPSVLVLMMVNGPALRPSPRLLVAVVTMIVSASIFAAALRLTERRGGSVWQDLIVQLGLMALIGCAVWCVAGPLERGDTLLYRHVLLPVTALVGVSLLLGAAPSGWKLFRSPRGRSSIPSRLREVELLVIRDPSPPRVTCLMLVGAAVDAVTSSPGRVLLVPALVMLLAEREWVTWFTFCALLATNTVLLAFANLDSRFNASWTVALRAFFSGWSVVVSAFVIVFGLCRVADFQYVATLFDGARNWTIVGYLFVAYALASWWDYWSSTFISLRFLDLLGGCGNGVDARVEYPILLSHACFPASDRVIQSHGFGRLLVLDERSVPPVFHSYEASAMADALADGLSLDDPTRADLSWVKQRIDYHFLVASIVLVGLLAFSLYHQSQLPQLPHIDSSQTASDGLGLAETILPATICDRDPGETVIAIAASGGGTRAALYTTSVLERLHELERLDDVRIMSGVSGGGAALAYFAGSRTVLLSSKVAEEPWKTFFEAMRQPYIEDVIDGSGEWRIASNHRLGRLLAESFDRHWPRDRHKRFGDVKDVGILLNSAIAGRYDRQENDDPKAPLAIVERRNWKAGRSDVAGGRVVYTNLNLQDHLWNPDLFDGAGRDDTRDSRLPIFVIKDPTVTLAAATAANANFPPVFSNAAIDRDSKLRLWVTDGGAIDNRGTETLLMTLKRAVLEQLERGSCAKLPALYIIEAEASAVSHGYSQDRGLGSMMSAGTAFASQLDAELLADIRDLYTKNGQDPNTLVQFHFVPMPVLLRQSGSFGTHWMMQERITVCMETQQDCEPIELTGDEVVTILRNLDHESLLNGASDAAGQVHKSIRGAKGDHTAGWERLRENLEG